MSKRWEYEPRGNPKPKHGWSKNEPGFVTEPGGAEVGKCPSGLSVQDAQDLLNDGIEWTNPRSHHKKDWPEQIYVVYQGAIYRAIPTRPGKSYHGFPANRRVARRLKKRLLERARDLGCEIEVKRWMRQYMGMKQI